MQDILSLNNLEQSDSLVYLLPNVGEASFEYSDGAETERYLYDVLSKASDLSCRSPELQSAIKDWPSEYHLTSDRSNLLRPFDLSGVSRVLELGSGCGAISRYLGEQGFIVDSVEGSRIRAALGKLRCRDLDNVRVINANYNDLKFPQGHYDLVLFVGVIEYARKFHPDADSDIDAARRILQQAGEQIHDKGAVLVAIENRLGLKYMMGVHEDHYAKRYIGINDYVDSAGIATYSRPQWDGLVREAGFAHKAVSYPFPDYKVPSVVLSESYTQKNIYASNHLEGLQSRDYFAPIKRPPAEMVYWQAASHGGFIGDLANSFCLLMGHDAQAIAKIQSFDFCHGPGSGRKNIFAVTTSKANDSELVQKDLEHGSWESSSQGITQRLTPQALIEGNLLSAQWLRTILVYVRREELDQALTDYYRFLGEEEAANSLAIDLLPINIVVRPDGGWQVFDQEWIVEWEISKEYVLFRALLTFIVSNWLYIRDFLAWLELQTVRDFIEYGFHANQIHLSEHIDEFVEMENRFQKEIARDPESQDVDTLLSTVFDFTSEDDIVYAAVRWRYDDEEFVEAQRSSLEVSVSPEIKEVSFDLGANGPLAGLRFDPFDLRRAADVGFYRVASLSLVEISDQGERVLWALDSEQDIAKACHPESTAPQELDGSIRWLALTDFPKMQFELATPIETNAEMNYQLRISFAIVRTKEYAMAYKHYLVESRSHEKTIERMNLNFTSIKSVLGYLQDKASDLENRANLLEGNLRNVKRENESIKQGKPFLIGSKIINVVERLRGLIGR